MRVKLSMVAAAVALTALALVTTSPADAGPGEPVNTFTVNKVVEGPVPAGTVFAVEVACLPNLGAPTELVATVTMEFDETGAPLTENSVDVGLYETCTAEETDDGGAASVAYSCDVSAPIDAPTEGFFDLECEDDQTVRFGEVVAAQGTITVTNTFEDAPPPPPDVEPDDVLPDVVNATPTFTG
jgi:hypothetical protein